MFKFLTEGFEFIRSNPAILQRFDFETTMVTMGIAIFFKWEYRDIVKVIISACDGIAYCINAFAVGALKKIWFVYTDQDCFHSIF